jgi:ubiquinone/menaquinone biosynthesis C-methylase UbiE
MPANHKTTRINYDRLSCWYDILSGSSERPARLRGIQILGIEPGECILEIGCGTGESLPMLASRAGHAGIVIGLDLSLGMLQVAKHKLERQSIKNVNFMQGDGICLPFGKDVFHAIFMSFTLELFSTEEIPNLLLECSRVLRPGGRMGIVSLLQKDEPGWMENAYNWAHCRWPTIIDCRPISLTSHLEQSGFTIREMVERSMWGLVVGIAVSQVS